MPGPVTVGLDGSPESLEAAEWAAGEARRRGLALRLVHAWAGLADMAEEPDLPELAVPRYWARRILRESEALLALRHPGLSIVADQVAGSPVEALVAAADDADMLVLGSRGLGRISGFLVGSVARATVAHARRPVVLVRAGRPSDDGEPLTGAEHREVVLALDPASDCDPLIGFAFDIAARRAAPLRVVHTWSPPPSLGGGPSPEAAAQARSKLTAALRPWRAAFPDQEVIERLLVGRPSSLPDEGARAELMVIGRRIRASAVGPHIGPIAHAVIHHAQCPVAVVPHG